MYVRPSGTQLDGAELWVNGVFLGKTPYVTTLGDFKAKVPDWPKPPADYETDYVKAFRDYGPNGGGWTLWNRWVKFDLPNLKTYYARIRYAGEWAGGNFGGGNEREDSWGASRVITDIACVFPERRKRLETLLSMARVANYRVGPAWFETLETYSEDGWLAIHKAAENEPRMTQVIDAWATWRYRLDTVTDADSAWRAFQKICNEADARGEYSTASLAGRAVELLVPKLLPRTLVDKSVEFIQSGRLFPMSVNWQAAGRLEFGRKRTSDADYSDVRPSDRYLPTSGVVLAHAVWMLNDRLRSRDEPEPNIIQQRIVPELIHAEYNTQSEYLMR